jgi:HPt (histidine-containing phosphotransfer) domain-containing protein
MDDFLSKPVLATRLIAVIEHHLHSARRAGASTHGLRTGDPHPGSGALPVFDPSMLASLPMVADGSQPEFATQVLQQFVKLVPRVLSSMADALQRGDGTTLQRDLHTLKSSAATIGAPALAHMAENAETGLRAGNAPTPDHVLQLQRCFDELIQELQQRGATPSAKGNA